MVFEQNVCNVPKPIVLMIDEVDSASNNQVFIDFLAQLRGYYLDRERRSIFIRLFLRRSMILKPKAKDTPGRGAPV